VNATVEAAEIAGIVAGSVGVLGIAGAVMTAVVSYRATKKATSRTIAAGIKATRATLSAAREDRLWEKRCAAYEETLTELLYRQAKRRHDLRGYRWDENSEQQLKEFFDSYSPSGPFEAQGRMVAYASDAVLGAFQAASQAHGEIRARYQRYSVMADDNKLATQSGQIGIAHGGEETIAARRAVDVAVEDAEAKDDELIKLIRDELRKAPEAAIPSSPLPSRPRRLWHRR
jgi:hypothetical protein